MTYRNHRILAWAVLQVSILCHSGYSVADVEVRTLDQSYPAEALPYALKYHTYAPPDGQLHACVDLNGDGAREFIYHYTIPAGDCNHSNAVVCYSGQNSGQVIFQYNGPFMSAKVWYCDFMDVTGGPGNEIIMTKTVRDSIILEIVSADSVFQLTTNVILAAVGHGLSAPGAWQAVHSRVLAAVDLNSDGYRDIIYNVTTKPDSAVEREMVAYDLHNKKRIWSFPLADQLGPDRFRYVETSPHTGIFVFTVISTCNRYASRNRFESNHAYAVAIDLGGKEQWRREVGQCFFYPGGIGADVNGDGRDEFVVTVQQDTVFVALQALNVLTGDEICRSTPMPGKVSAMWRVTDSLGRPGFVLTVGEIGPASVSYRFDNALQLLAICTNVTASSMVDLNGDGKQELISLPLDGVSWVLDDNLRPLARGLAERSGGLPRKLSPGDVTFNDYPSLGVVSLIPQGPLLRLYARNRAWIITLLYVGAATLLLWAIIVAAHRIRNLYLTAAGVPGLDKVDSMVLIIGRTGKLLFANRHPLVKELFGGHAPSRKPLSKQVVPGIPALVKLSERSFEDMRTPLHEVIELKDNGSTRRLSVTAYPRLDRDYKFDGRILIAEDITTQTNWQRKVILGEAAQRWMHKVKGSMATTRIYLENLKEDPRLGQPQNSDVLNSYVSSISSELEETVHAASRILRFASISKPNREPCDLNALIEKALRPLMENRLSPVTVAKSLQFDLPPIWADASQIADVVDNLLSNALKAMKNSGQLTVQTQVAGNLQGIGTDRCIQLAVTDTGVGIAQEDRERIFTPGFSKSGSTGVGLALVKEIVENHGGTVAVESEPGQGSCFRVRFPMGETTK